MVHIEESVTCRAPAVEVWKLLHDPARFTEWWAGVSRVEATEGGATLYPDGQAATPTRITAGRDGRQVVISCLMTDDIYTWVLEPHPDGCRIAVRVEVADGDAERLSQRHAGVLASLPRLVAAAERVA
jgi:uncharacterized protein YndB with AHSA1/START domain